MYPRWFRCVLAANTPIPAGLEIVSEVHIEDHAFLLIVLEDTLDLEVMPPNVIRHELMGRIMAACMLERVSI